MDTILLALIGIATKSFTSVALVSYYANDHTEDITTHVFQKDMVAFHTRSQNHSTNQAIEVSI